MSGEVAKPGQLGSGGDGTDAGMFNAPPKCWGCSKPIDGGSAIQFADGVWHIDCFQCTTCGKVIEFDSNLLFLADGKPICPECSYCCSLCKKPIFDEAIVTVEGTYHSECFRCTNCKQRIQGKSFAKTSQGVIYCVNCYADRREKKKAAKRRREHQVLEEKALPQLPVDSPSELPAKDGPSFPSPLNVRATGGDVASPIPGSAATAGNINSPANVGGADPAARQPHSASLVDYKSRQLPLINNSTPVAEKTPLSARNEPSSARADMPLAKQLQLGTASAPVSPMGADKPMPAPIQVTELQPPIPVIPPLDPGLEAGLTWTEDIGALENNFIRLSTRNSIRQKNSDSIASSIAASLNTKNGAGGGHAQPGDNGGSDNDAWYKSGSTPSSASKPRADIQASMQRTRTTSSSDNMRSMVPPGLRSRDSTPVDGFARGVPEKGDAGRPHTRTGTEKAFELEGKEWLDNASVAQLKEELLVNYGQLCRMEISFQRLREHYTTVVNQLVDTRQSLMQERAKRMEYENILRNYYGYIDESPLPESSAKFATGQQRGGNNSPAPVDKDGKPGASTKANGRAMGKHKEGALSAAQIGRSLSIRRQKPAKPQQQASSAQDHNDSGSDAEDAIITTVPQKATKRFIWPF
ncbi:Rho-type gtpase-activating protein, partial [Dipsacomyces acuminosporus]